MYKPLLLTSLGLLASATDYKHFDCGTDSSAATEEFMQTVQSLHSNSNPSSGSPAVRAASIVARNSTTPINVPVVFHIVASSAKKDAITSAMAQSQFQELNRAYGSAGIQFALANMSWTVNDSWAVGGTDADDLAMKQALRQGSYATLNIYFQTDLAGGVLGKCTLPSSVGGGTVAASAYANDGCNVQAGTMPGGAVAGYNQGKTAVHEAGHWFGLLHVFEGNSCDGDGDFIADTPQQSTSTDGCPTAPPKDSCPSDPGLDAVHNYMDYSTDACYTGFSPLQQARMMSMWGMYRQGK
ncbi:zincin [Glonium stellatum]|uniref:Zincin n=1 Tax=Glonium stellatum TaxID=574774 RepID=A0A8E2F592_9PEZI|nr:zincin [Glonium stellatum]